MKKIILLGVGAAAVWRATPYASRAVEHFRATRVLQTMEISMVMRPKEASAATAADGVMLDSEV
ncbi:hypothetical protein [Aeromicrobium sp. UC242_57]|uniref:hypothetical protein n=1 Tax=Aeromicrobium sp. UC242_57 TaxID=3374624 RepID=UPI0037BBB748